MCIKNGYLFHGVLDIAEMAVSWLLRQRRTHSAFLFALVWIVLPFHLGCPSTFHGIKSHFYKIKEPKSKIMI